MGLWPVSARRQAPDVRAGGQMSGASRGAGCPGLGPDVRAEVAKLRVRSVVDAGFPGEGPDVRALARRRMSGAGAGCPAADAVGRLLGQLLRGCPGAGCPASGPDVRPL